MKLLKVDTVEQAREKLLSVTESKILKTEYVQLGEAQGRILAEDIFAVESVPEFKKSTVDGYAVISQNTQGVTDSIPAFLEIIEEIEIGKPAAKTIKQGQCSYVPTGGMIPEGADAVVMIEYTEPFDDRQIAVYDSVSKGRNIIQIGEDIKSGESLLARGTCIRPQEAGALASLGYSNIKVFAKPKITIISTGDELVSIDEKPSMGKIRDINTYTIEALCIENNIEVIEKKTLEDNETLLEEAIRNAMKHSDIVVTGGGSSQGKKDFTAKVMDRISEPGVFTHGIALKPGKPTIIAFDEKTDTILMGLPGHPVAAIMVFRFFIIWLLKIKMEQNEGKKLTATMETNVAGGSGRAGCIMVQLIEKGTTDKGNGENEINYIARPILGKSALITTLTKADGYTLIETNKEGLKEGETVKVTLF